MGIPRFVRTLISRYPLIIKNILNKEELPSTDYFYIDLRHIIHEISHGDKENILFLIKNKSFPKMYEEVCMAIEELINTVHPKNFVMIADDGICPIAKLTEIIKRRFIGGHVPSGIFNFLISIGLEPKDITLFERDLISPGTKFMHDLEEYILEFIRNKQKNDIYWQSIDIVYSGANVEGEGEHKIISHIREYQRSENYKEQTNFTIYSNDGDMILLSLLIHEPNIIIIQEDNVSSNEDKIYKHEFNKEHIFFINNQVIMISVLREYLDIEFNDLFNEDNIIEFKYNLNNILDDFVLICLLLGNDFIPGLMSLDREGRAFEYLLKAYKKTLPKCDNYIVKNTIINFKNLKEYFLELSKFEKDLLNSKIVDLKIHYSILQNKKTYSAFKYYCDTMNEEIKSRDEKPDKKEILEIALNSNQLFVKTLINSFENENNNRLLEKDIPYEDLFFVKFMNEYNKEGEDIEKAKKMYYKKKLENKKLSEFYFAYLAGLQWIYYYYSNGISNYNWMYKYHYVPFISDLSNFEISENFKELIDKKIIDINSKPLSSYALSCLTFNDKNFNELLPKQFSKVKKVLNSYFRDVNKSKIDLNGEIFIRNGYLLQPFITSKQLNDLNKTITEIYKDLSENYKQLNAVKKSIIFHKNKNLLDNIDNEYMINLINLFKEKCITLNSNKDEMRNNFNYYIDNFSNELFIDINKNYMPYIKDKEKNNFILKIKNIFDIFINYNISKEEYDIDIKFNKDILEGNNNNKDMILNMNKFTDVAYPRINYLSYEYNEETTKLEFGKKYKFTKITKALKITILSKYINIINENNKNEIIENILNQKIVLYDIPMKKIGIIEGVYYNDKYYYLNEDKIEGIQSDEIRQNLKYQKSFLDYEKSNIFIKIKDIKVIKDKNNENINLVEIIN